MGLPVYTSLTNQLEDEAIQEQIKYHKRVHKVTKKGFIENIYIFDDNLETDGSFDEEEELAHKVSLLSRFLNNEFDGFPPEDEDDREIIANFKQLDGPGRVAEYNELKKRLLHFS